jgi:hypothetical protein
MRARILKKIYHHTNNPMLSTPFRRQREDHWIKNLGSVFPYVCNNNINTLRNSTSPLTNNVNVMGLFHNNKRCRRSHEHRSYNRPAVHDVTLMSLYLMSASQWVNITFWQSFTLFHWMFCIHCLNKPKLVHTWTFQHQNIHLICCSPQIKNRVCGNMDSDIWERNARHLGGVSILCWSVTPTVCP